MTKKLSMLAATGVITAAAALAGCAGGANLSQVTCEDFISATNNLGRLDDKSKHSEAEQIINSVLQANGVPDVGDLTPEAVKQQGELAAQLMDYCGFTGGSLENADKTLDGFKYKKG